MIYIEVKSRFKARLNVTSFNVNKYIIILRLSLVDMVHIFSMELIWFLVIFLIFKLSWLFDPQFLSRRCLEKWPSQSNWQTDWQHCVIEPSLYLVRRTDFATRCLRVYFSLKRKGTNHAIPVPWRISSSSWWCRRYHGAISMSCDVIPIANVKCCLICCQHVCCSFIYLEVGPTMRAISDTTTKPAISYN